VSIEVDARSADECPVAKVEDFLELIECVRSRSVVSHVDDHTGTDELGRVGADNFNRQVVTFVNGSEHLQRRKKWNTLLRGDSVATLREQVMLPAFERQLERRETAAEAVADKDSRALAAVIADVRAEASDLEGELARTLDAARDYAAARTGVRELKFLAKLVDDLDALQGALDD